MTIAFAPCATAELTSEIIFCRSPPPAKTICLTFLHFAASDRTAAYDSCDHALMPNPSRTPRVICLLPQNEVSVEIPDLAISCDAVGEVNVFVAAAVAVTAAKARTTSTSALNGSLRRVFSSDRARSRALLVIVVLLVISTLL